MPPSQLMEPKRPPAKAGRDLRSLASLGDTATTSRVLNLSEIARTSRDDPDYATLPFFRDPRLNKCILIKHTLRNHELGHFQQPRRTATKLVLPFDGSNLKLGGSSIFVGEMGFEAFCKDFLQGCSLADAHPDIELLMLLDTIPTLDPFLLRELLSRHGYRPAACYLRISPADVQKMLGFANSEIERLVSMAFGSANSAASLKLTTRILSNALDTELSDLQQTLMLSDHEFSEGIFSWRGFLYFKWRYLQMKAEMQGVFEGLSSYQPRRLIDPDTAAYLKSVRPALVRKITSVMTAIGRALSVYDRAYRGLVERGEPALFRDFLLNGPRLFYELGECCGVIGHIGSFWAYRLSPGQGRMDAMDYAEVLMDFEDSLAIIDGIKE
ncbi:hypothetical protein PQU94_06950 [Asticcacaulis sp. DXS10W]|uniref:Uncharacterized protein n=1 Tax=Asticcacaulis currens TaxID=2984210 RepID=A0ABT5ICY2_9CAUL|nr:hypothetical protein [Asticcacaulis currens]MDC7694019.1 hypothetical protein [Asticcacaulis currens]